MSVNGVTVENAGQLAAGAAGLGGNVAGGLGDCMRGVCLAGGTLVMTASGPVPIEDVAIGARMAAVVMPDGVKGDAACEEEEYATWQVASLRMSNPDPLARGDVYEIRVMRPAEWFAERGMRAGVKAVWEIEELGVNGIAEVVSVGPAPRIAPGPGRVVTGTISHLNSYVYRLTLVGRRERRTHAATRTDRDPGRSDDDPDGCAAPLLGDTTDAPGQHRGHGALATLELTDLHPLHSADRCDWIRAADLRVGERLTTRTGVATVVAIERVPGTYRVYNLEVEGEHCYYASTLEVLSHNAGSCTGGNNPAPKNALADTSNLAKPLGRGSTGRIAAANLNEQLAMKQAMSDPAAGLRLNNVTMTDPRWPASDGWVKMSQRINGTEVHYVRNTVTGAVDDFKFK